MSADQVLKPSVFTIKQTVKEKQRKFDRVIELIKRDRSFEKEVMARFKLQMELLDLIGQFTGSARHILLGEGTPYADDASYIAVAIDKAFRTGNYEDIQKCLIIVKSIIVNNGTRRGAIKQAKMFTDAISRVAGWYSVYISTIKNGKLTSKTRARFNGNWKKPMIIIELRGIRQVVITEHTIDVTKRTGRMDKTKLIVDLV